MNEPDLSTAARLVDSLEVAVLLLSADLEVEYANGRWSAWLGAPLPAGTHASALLEDADPLVVRELSAALRDGERRILHLTLRSANADVAPRRIVATVRRVGNGLLLEARIDVDEDRLAVHDVARRLAEVNDMAEVLQTLCEIAAQQCGATGASVLRIRDGRGEVVASVGDMALAMGRNFDLEGSMLSDAVTRQEIAIEQDFSGSDRPLARSMPDIDVGPAIAAPLKAHGEILGVISVTRRRHGRAFHAREIERLRLLTDHAALAVHKSLLLMQAQSADRAKGRFLATISHELRTPLTALAGYNELLADQVIGPLSDPQLDILERMRSVTMHLSAMIEEILAFTSLEEGREIVRPSEFLAADLLHAAIAVVEPLAETKGLRLELDLPQKSVRLLSDIDKSRQILVNLLGNAIKFTDSGTITLRLLDQREGVRIEVKDTGIGIPDDEMPRLFRPFAQVDSGLTRRHGGTGLGLYISRRLATLLRGHIEISSSVGVGSTFTVVLPHTLPS